MSAAPNFAPDIVRAWQRMHDEIERSKLMLDAHPHAGSSFRRHHEHAIADYSLVVGVLEREMRRTGVRLP